MGLRLFWIISLTCLLTGRIFAASLGAESFTLQKGKGVIPIMPVAVKNRVIETSSNLSADTILRKFNDEWVLAVCFDQDDSHFILGTFRVTFKWQKNGKIHVTDVKPAEPDLGSCLERHVNRMGIPLDKNSEGYFIMQISSMKNGNFHTPPVPPSVQK